jgi:hypothetical protein
VMSLMLGPAWMALERRLRAAEGLGDRLSRFEAETIRRTRRVTDPCVAEARGSVASLAWFAGRVADRFGGRAPSIWPPRIAITAAEPGAEPRD